jgi:hypothetical protein
VGLAEAVLVERVLFARGQLRPVAHVPELTRVTGSRFEILIGDFDRRRFCNTQVILRFSTFLSARGKVREMHEANLEPSRKCTARLYAVGARS